MRGKLIITYPDRPEEVEELDAAPSLQRIQSIVGGFIERVPYFDKITWDGERHACVAFCNEEGKLIGLPRNVVAQILWESSLGGSAARDYLVGPIAIVIGDRALMESL